MKDGMTTWWNYFGTMEFSLSEFHWIVTKSKNSMVTRDTPCLTIDQFLGVVVKYSFKKTLKFTDCKKFKISMI